MRLEAVLVICIAVMLSSLASTLARAANDGDRVAALDTDAEKRTVRVLLLSSSAAEWPTRAWGQLSDLPVVLDSESGPIDSSTLAPENIRAFAEARAVEIVAWLSLDSPTDPSTRIVIYETREQRLHTRAVGGAWAALGPGDRSAALEVAALTLRSVLRSMLDKVETPAARAPEAPRAWRLRTGAAAGWQLDGQTPRGALSLGAELGVAWPRGSLSLGGQWGLDADVAAREATLRLARHLLFVEARYYPLEAGSLELGALVRAGLAIMQRETIAASELAVALPDSSQSSALLGVGAVSRWRPSREHALELAVVAHGFAAPSRYVVRAVETDQDDAYQLWRLQPSVALGWALTF